MRSMAREILGYYNEMNRYSIWVMWITAAVGLLLFVWAVIVPRTALSNSDPVLAAELAGQFREAGFGVLAVGLVLSCVGDVIVKYDHIDI